MPKHRKKGATVEYQWWKSVWATSASEVDQELAKDAIKRLGRKKKAK